MSNPYPYQYNRKINKAILKDYEQNPAYNSPDDVIGLDLPSNGPTEGEQRIVGGSKYRKHKSNYVHFAQDDENEYYQPGNMPIPPYLNMDEARKMNKMDTPYEYLQGTGKPKRKGGAIGIEDSFGSYRGETPSNPLPNQSKAKSQSSKKKKGIPGHVLSTALDIVPLLATGATTIGLSGTPLAPVAPFAGPIAGYALSKGREAIREKTGYGHQPNSKSKVGKKRLLELEIDARRSTVGEELKPEPRVRKNRKNRSTEIKQYQGGNMEGINAVGGSKRKTKASDSTLPQNKRAQRNILVKQIMAEQGCSLPQASAFIKKNNLM